MSQIELIVCVLLIFCKSRYGIITQLINDQSQESVSIQKQILKIYFALTQYVLPLDLITKEIFSNWMEVLRVITESDVPDHTLQVDEEERPQLIWWKRKKWALHTLTRLFERYERCYVDQQLNFFQDMEALEA